MMLIQEILGLETVLGLMCATLLVVAMLILGMTIDLVKLVRNPYRRQRLGRIMIIKAGYAFA